MIFKKCKASLLLISLLLPGFSGLTQQPDAREIVRRADQKLKGKTSFAELTIEIIRPSWKREMKIKSWSKGDKYSLICVTAPARDKGTVSLKRDKEVWNWMPSIERTIKLPPSMMSQSWMGTDFTNDDLVRQSSVVEDYTHELNGEAIMEGLACYRITMTPKPDAPVVWGKVIVYIDKKDYMQMRAEFYDEAGELVNIMVGADVRTFGGKTLPSKLEMIPADNPGHKTVMTYSNLVFDQPIEDSFFTVQNMKTIK